MPYPLQVRHTYTYRDGWSYEDEWENIGTYVIEARSEKTYSDESYEDAFSQILLVRVDSEHPEELIRKALEASLSGSSCQHDYDCCGCYSYYATATALTRDYYRVVYSGARNY